MKTFFAYTVVGALLPLHCFSQLQTPPPGYYGPWHYDDSVGAYKCPTGTYVTDINFRGDRIVDAVVSIKCSDGTTVNVNQGGSGGFPVTLSSHGTDFQPAGFQGFSAGCSDLPVYPGSCVVTSHVSMTQYYGSVVGPVGTSLTSSVSSYTCGQNGDGTNIVTGVYAHSVEDPSGNGNKYINAFGVICSFLRCGGVVCPTPTYPLCRTSSCRESTGLCGNNLVTSGSCTYVDPQRHVHLGTCNSSGVCNLCLPGSGYPPVTCPPKTCKTGKCVPKTGKCKYTVTTGAACHTSTITSGICSSTGICVAV